MRAAVFLLLLGNLALLGMLYRDLQAPQAPHQPPESDSLRAISHGAGLVGDCLVSEAFSREVEARLATFRLDIPHTFVVRYQEVSDGWRVHLPSTDSLESARRELRRLQEAGIDGPALATGGDPSNMVSIAVHADQADAESVSRRVQALGFDAQVSPRRSREPGYHLVLQAEEAPEHLSRYGWTAEACSDALP
ncbi:SPOR domain-containing protein [Methylonatrum kenyense]|uniref:SPOR domain-containing protein n=1 Tax=Methylonatrum kenyense TaxID=455253 RepID=UPI0020BDE822|nr:SPOR domain-containing protein [Methylonatrum kenyense]MCK8517164.1 SPOR domain-containing protein [Methylonatrum kenyense]